MKVSYVFALFLAGLVTAESFNNVQEGAKSELEARAKKPKPPSSPPPANPPPANPPPANPPPANPPPANPPAKPPTPANPPANPPPGNKPPPGKPNTPTPVKPGKTPTPTPTPDNNAAYLKGPFTQYVVYTKKPTDKTGNAKLKKLLHKYVKTPAKDIQEFGIKGRRINYWELPLNAKAVKELKRDRKFNGIATAKCKGKCFNPLAAVTKQSPAEPELVFFSQKEGTTLDQYKGEFSYEEEAGKGVTCYLLDDGANGDLPEFANAKPRFIYPEGITPAEKVPGITGLDHGTCMLSKYVGKEYGIAKNCDPVVVKIPFLAPRQIWLNGLSAVIKDVEGSKGRKKAVLSMSLYWPAAQVKDAQGDLDQGWIDSLFESLRDLARLNVVLVAAAGNDGIGNIGKKDMDGYPAIMGAHNAPTTHKIPSMIVVGAMNAVTGKMWHKSNFDNGKKLPHVFAPGERVKCFVKGNAEVSDGTSQATASVAGLAAYFMSLPGGPTTPTAMKKKIEDTAWKQGNGGIAGKVDPPLTGMVRVWNEVTVTFAQRLVRGIDWRRNAA